MISRKENVEKTDKESVGAEESKSSLFEQMPEEMVQYVAQFLPMRAVTTLGRASRFFHRVLDKNFYKNTYQSLTAMDYKKIHDAILFGLKKYLDDKEIAPPSATLQDTGEFDSVLKGMSDQMGALVCSFSVLTSHVSASQSSRKSENEETPRRFTYSYELAYHRQACFMHIFFNRPIPLQTRMFAAYVLINDFSALSAGEMSKMVREYENLEEADIARLNFCIEKMFDEQDITKMREQLNLLIVKSYSLYYKNNGYTANESCLQFWQRALQNFGRAPEQDVKKKSCIMM